MIKECSKRKFNRVIPVITMILLPTVSHANPLADGPLDFDSAQNFFFSLFILIGLLCFFKAITTFRQLPYQSADPSKPNVVKRIIILFIAGTGLLSLATIIHIATHSFVGDYSGLENLSVNARIADLNMTAHNRIIPVNYVKNIIGFIELLGFYSIGRAFWILYDASKRTHENITSVFLKRFIGGLILFHIVGFSCALSGLTGLSGLCVTHW